LNHCKHLKTLPNSFGWLEQLEYLDMSYNPCLEVLPESFGRLKALDYLELQGCSIGGKIGLPLEFGKLIMLRILSLDKTLIEILPKSFKDLNALLNLHIHQCPNLVFIQALPRNLEYFDIAQCPKLVDIPCLSNLSSLKYFMLHYCPRLTHLQGLESMKALVQVRISGCKILYTNPSMNHDGALQMCNLSGSMMSMKYDTNWWKVTYHTLVQMCL
jgi:Leucine-rich repeat (LRR) protein